MTEPLLIFPYRQDENCSIAEFIAEALDLAFQLDLHYSGEVIGFLGQKTKVHLSHLYGAYLAGNPFYHFNLLNTEEFQLKIIRELKIKYLYVDEDFFSLFLKLKKEIPELEQIHLSLKGAKLKVKKQEGAAYYISTSGSSGTPKLIEILHHQFERALQNIELTLLLEKSDVYLHLSDMSFDVALMDFFIPLRQNISLCVLSRLKIPLALNVVKSFNVTVWSSAPYLAKFVFHFRKDKEILPSLKKIIHCGEIFDRELLLFWRSLTTEALIINLYGPSEATIAISAFTLKPEEDCPDDVLPIGDIFKGHEYEIAEHGELFIKGEQVIKNYFGRTEPILINGFYPTGDSVFVDDKKQLVCQGRIDDQIKIAGMRFNLLSVEHFLKLYYPKRVLACLCEQEEIFVLMEKSAEGEVLESQLKSELARHIPSPFVPKKIIYVDSLPMNASGKLDRLSLRRFI